MNEKKIHILSLLAALTSAVIFGMSFMFSKLALEVAQPTVLLAFRFAVAVAALYHDASEILTGDLPTPIKYYNPAIRDAYKQVEHIACGKLVGMLPPELQPDFAEALTPTDPEVEELVKAADKLSAHIKCLEELKAGNLEFRRAAEQTEQALDDFHLPELTYFREHFLPSFRLTLDEME